VVFWFCHSSILGMLIAIAAATAKENNKRLVTRPKACHYLGMWRTNCIQGRITKGTCTLITLGLVFLVAPSITKLPAILHACLNAFHR